MLKSIIILKTIILIFFNYLVYGLTGEKSQNYSNDVFKVALIEYDSTYNLLLQCDIREIDSISSINFSFFTFQNLSDDSYSKIIYQDSLYIGSTEKDFFLKFIFAKELLINENLKVQLLSESKTKNFTKIITQDDIKPFLLFDKENHPLLVTYTTKKLFHLSDTTKTYCFYYKNDFELPIPPYQLNNKTVKKQIKHDSLFSFSGTIAFHAPGLYLLQKDTLTNKALPVRFESEYFPKFTTIDELKPPLMYLCDSLEIKHLMKVGINKKKFDQFWIDFANGPQNAKIIIRNYYNRVKLANNRFSTFKQGWKTDMGMVFIVMGSPDIIHTKENEIEWIYRDNQYATTHAFIFIKTRSIFSKNHYVLIRNPYHKDFWNRKINLIKKGEF